MEDHVSAPRRFEGLRDFRKACAVLMALTLLYSASPRPASAAVAPAIDKNAAYQEMLSLAQQMTTLKPQIRSNAQAAAAYSAAESRYRDLSAAMGGDDPGHVLNNASTAASAQRAAKRIRPKVVPSTPAGCGPATATFTQSTPVAIPTGPAVVTSTVVVSGAGPYLFDLDLTTNITHTFAADLDITLTSPAGTVVTLTTDNGAGNDNVFNGTLWDDDANPAGQVPYTTNNGLVTDQAYVNLTTATPLVPEEAMGAFIGEDPNGTWTITISDDLAGDGGSLDSWSLDIDTFSCASADLSITKTDNATSASPGGTTTYTITASNAGPTAANPASVVDTFPAACTSVSYTSTAAGGATGNTAAGTGNINDTALNLPAGSSVTYTATCTISPAATGTLVNTATVASATPDPNAGNNSATDTDNLTASADLSLTKTLTTGGNIQVGQNVVFNLKVTNNGPANATGVVVTDTLPAGLTYVSNDCGATFASPTLTWNVGALAVGAMATCNLTATVNQPGTITNTASATGTEADPTPANNAATVAVVGATPVPTLDTLGLMAFIVLLGASAALALRRRRQA
jgi:uncharacterized repeat protein (TIGR01451 family)